MPRVLEYRIYSFVKVTVRRKTDVL